MNILFTSVGRRSYLIDFFRKEIGDGKIHVSNSSALSPAFKLADKHVITPLIYDEDYIPFLLNYCKENKIDMLVSLFDIDLMILSKSKEKFKEIGVKVVVSDEDVIKVCNDKWETYCFLKENGFNAPKTFLDLNEAMQAIENGELKYPVIIKPRWGMGSISVYKANNKIEMDVFYNKIKEEIFNTYLKYESMEDKEECVMIQQMLDGQEYGLDIINNLNKEYQATIIKKKIAMRSGETDCALTLKDENIVAVGKKISNQLGHIANLDVDVFVDGKAIYVLEMNARFGGGYPFSHIAGVNLPRAIIKWVQNQSVEKEVFDYKEVLAQKDIRIVELDKDTEGNMQ